jgi:hypothetical protein
MDTIVNVKIVDEKGNNQWDSDVHISGNELRIDDISFLPLGIYHIVCTNSQSTVTSARFFIKR